MSSRLVVDDASELKELEDYPLGLRIAAKIISYLFHPVFVPIYIVLFLLYVQTDIFIQFTKANKIITLLQAFVPYVMFPVVTVLLLKALNFIDSVYLKSRKDRIIPYIACNIWYFWIWNVWRQLPDYPKEIVLLSLSVFLASVIGFLANIYFKISMHCIAMGVLVAYMLLLALTDLDNAVVYVCIAVMIAGVVSTARFIVSDHSRKDIYTGLFFGIGAVFISSLFV